MRKTSKTVWTDRPAILAALVCVPLLLPRPVRADVDAYQVAVPLQGAGTEARAAAFADALRMAAVRASGRRDAGSVPAIASADPAKYVQQYGTTADHMLKVRFDDRAMEPLLIKAGLPLWPLERPVTLVLLEARTGAGGSHVVLAGEATPERAAIERAAQARGVPVAWPATSVDVARARAAARAGSVIEAAGSRPDARAVLVGSAGPGGVDWVFAHAGRAVQTQGGLEDGIHLAADSLAARYAPPSTRGLATVTIRVGGIGDVKAYAGLLEYLKSLSLVRDVAVEELSGDVVRLKLALRGDAELLGRIVGLDTRLTPAPVDAAAPPVDFSYQR